VETVARLARQPKAAVRTLLALKRPGLLAVRDRRIEAAVGVPADRQLWRPWWRTLAADEQLVRRLERLRDLVAAPELSLLRIAELAVWTREVDAAAAGGPSPAGDLPRARWFHCPLDEERVDAPHHDTGPHDAPAGIFDDDPLGLDEFDGWENLEVDDSDDMPVDPATPLTTGGTAPAIVHARLWTFVGDVPDGRPGWRPPLQRLRAHLEGERDLWIASRNWSRAYDDHLHPSPGVPTPPDDDGEPDVLVEFDRDATAVALRQAVDDAGDLIHITPEQILDCINGADPWDLVARIPSGPRLQDIGATRLERYFGPGSHVDSLIRTLTEHGVSPRAARLFCARVRPHLVPIPDRFVECQLGIAPHEDALPLWAWALEHDRRLVDALEDLGMKAGARYLSILRIADILVLQRAADLRLALETSHTLFPFDPTPASGWSA
jgi:hypothetical protein